MTPTRSIVDADASFYVRVGGHGTFRDLIHAFFREVKAAPELAALYPADDWEGAEQRLLMFFEQYYGGPSDYSRTRGAPRLKMRHMYYKITPHLRDVWAGCMERAIATVDLRPEDAAEIRAYVERAAQYLVNAD